MSFQWEESSQQTETDRVAKPKMNAEQTVSIRDETIESQREFHRIYWDFETACRKGQRPEIEEYLGLAKHASTDELRDKLREERRPEERRPEERRPEERRPEERRPEERSGTSPMGSHQYDRRLDRTRASARRPGDGNTRLHGTGASSR